MFERFTRDARAVVTAALAEAGHRGERHIGTEHLLLGVLASPDRLAGAALAAAGLDLAAARRALDATDDEALAAVGVDTAVLAPPRTADAADPGGRRPRWRRSHRPFTGGAKQVLEGALRQAVGLGHRWIGTEHLLLALTARAEPDPAVRLLARLDVDPAAVHADVVRRLAAAA